MPDLFNCFVVILFDENVAGRKQADSIGVAIGFKKEIMNLFKLHFEYHLISFRRIN
jgi:hypothetical protein